MSEEHAEAGELDEAEEVFDMVFPSRDESAVVLHPGKEPFDFPSAAVAAQEAAILRLLFAVGRDHLDAVLAHLSVESVGVISLVANQSFG